MKTPPANLRCTRNDGKSWKCKRRRLHDKNYCEQHFRHFNQLKLRQIKSKPNKKEEEVGEEEKIPLIRWMKNGKHNKNLDEKYDLVGANEIKEEEGLPESEMKKFEVEEDGEVERIPLSTWANSLDNKKSKKHREKCDLDATKVREVSISQEISVSGKRQPEIEKMINGNGVSLRVASLVSDSAISPSRKKMKEDKGCSRNDEKSWKCRRRRLCDRKYCQQHFRHFNQLKLRQKKYKPNIKEEEVGVPKAPNRVHKNNKDGEDEKIPLEREENEKIPLIRWMKNLKHNKNLDEKCDLVGANKIKEEEEGSKDEEVERLPLSTWANSLKKKKSKKYQEKYDLDAINVTEIYTSQDGSVSEKRQAETEKTTNGNDEAKDNTFRNVSGNSGMEDNLISILDVSGVKQARDLHDDQLAFLEAVRAASLVSDNAVAPSSKMFGAIFGILKDRSSLELTMASYQLLIELDKHFPRVKLTKSNRTTELVVVEQAWSPFSLGPDSVYNEIETRQRNIGDPLDSLDFSHLTESIAHEFDQVNHPSSGMKLVRDMMLFQYLVSVLEHDFACRYTVYKETKSSPLLKESILNMLLGSRRISYKGLMKNCVSIVSIERCHRGDVTSNKLGNIGLPKKGISSCDASLYVSCSELKEGTYIATQKFLIQILELDNIKNEAESQNQVSISDGARTPLLEIIVDELNYHEEIISRFLQVFSDPKWKLEIIQQYISKYTTKPSVQTQRSSSSEDIKFNGVLSCFSSYTSTKSIIQKTSSGVVQLLLAHAFQAYLTLRNNKHVDDLGGSGRDSSLMQISQDVIAAFQSLRGADKKMEMIPTAKGALFTAAVLSMKYKQARPTEKKALP